MPSQGHIDRFAPPGQFRVLVRDISPTTPPQRGAKPVPNTNGPNWRGGDFKTFDGASRYINVNGDGKPHLVMVIYNDAGEEVPCEQRS